MMNLIYFNPDEMRGDAVSVGGHRLVKTPNLDRLAARGTVFTQCHVQHTVCTPSRCSFMTGLYPHVHGHRTLWHALRPHEPNTFMYLADKGYQVHVFGKNDVLSEESARLWVTSVPPITRDRDETIHPVVPYGQPGYQSFLYEPVEGNPPDYYHVKNAVEQLGKWKEGEAPFFLFLPLSYPHCPYRVPREYYDMYDPDDLPPLEKVREEGAPLYHGLIRKYRELDKLEDSHFRKIMAVYLGMISYNDYLLGLLMDEMDRLDRWKDTAFFFFSDHGDWAGDYGLVEKWPSGLDNKLTHVPLLISAPLMKTGHRVDEAVELQDIFATTMELLDIPFTHTQFGRSLVPQLKGAPGDRDRAIFGEGGYGEHEPHCFEGKETGDQWNWTNKHIYYPKCRQQQEFPRSVSRSVYVRQGGWKFIRRSSGDHELYHLDEDMGEQNNLYAQAIQDIKSSKGTPLADRLREMESRLIDHYLLTSDTTPLFEDPRHWPVIN
jgi:arylsulfatase A-like enzyme